MLSVLDDSPQSASSVAKALGWTTPATLIALNAGVDLRQVVIGYERRGSRRVGMYALFDKVVPSVIVLPGASGFDPMSK